MAGKKLKLRPEVIPTLRFLWDKRKQYKEYGSAESEKDARRSYFDYPAYGGLPKKLSNKLDDGLVDTIQYIWPPSNFKQFDKFQKAIFELTLITSCFDLK